ncbi:MAG: Crp/Fnr family transcriptional regulator, partial [Cytophagales bacterium]|nr:Crp/Fnr family transcriptional regulator [Cytophagales bacterium]
MPVKKKYCNDPNKTNCVTCLKKNFSLLDELSEAELARLDKNRTHDNFRKGETIYAEGNEPSGLLCLNVGKTKIIKKGLGDKEQIITMKRPVDFVGFSELMSQEVYSTSCVALEESSICTINKDDFFSVIKSNANFFMKISRFLSSEIHHNANRIIALTQKNLRARLADALLYIIKIYGLELDMQTLDVKLKRSDLAAISNMTTANVIRTLSD